MLQSNLPVQQQDTLWGGAIMGGLVGAGAGYGHYKTVMDGSYNDVMKKKDEFVRDRKVNQYLDENKLTRNDYGSPMDGDNKAHREKVNDYIDKKTELNKTVSANEEGRNKAKERISKRFGGSGSKQAAAHSVAGAALGMAIGSLTDAIL